MHRTIDRWLDQPMELREAKRAVVRSRLKWAIPIGRYVLPWTKAQRAKPMQDR